ncbi:D-alanine--poly(phosphoribitol) ligase subunit 2 [Pilibacter termitis]|uniref:D-alanyl carrier protein n=1 Tax=Pilibacter termitis TaxID=263852 RepID=A0A1T4M6X3_9ENTE|nr:D-alanine--poly(phosphoribitol) ligase subunit DltC [Pilibacter termitis]SJZ62662.1 D-alanine--poly(phosphoribitol) ligase subunit 2 [Pilibacter termitis]
MKEQVLDILEQVTASSEVREDLDLNLFDAGILDSMGSVMLMVELENAFGVTVPISEFDREEWDTPNKIIAKVEALGNA